MKLKAMTRAGYAETCYNLITEEQNGAAIYNLSAASANTESVAGANVTLKHVNFRHQSCLRDEGEVSITSALEARVNDRWGITGVAEVRLSSAKNWVLALDTEIDVSTA